MNHSGRFKNILIIKPGAIGDLLQLTPVIRALKRKYPDARLSILVGSKVTADLFRFNAKVQETIVFDKKGTHHSLLSLFRLRSLLRQKKYDLVINFQRSNLKTWFLASAAFPCRILIYHKTRRRNVHAVQNCLETVAPLAEDVSGTDLELIPGPGARDFAEKIISSLDDGRKPIIALNPGASHHVNRWGTDRFAALADRLANELSARVMVIGGTDDIPLAQEIGAGTASKPLLMAGKASLLELAALLEKCDILVSGDTGPMHVATAVGTRVLALFGAADPARTGPLGKGHRVIQAPEVSCVPCRSRTCSNKKYLECMEKISVENVYEAILVMLKNGPHGG